MSWPVEIALVGAPNVGKTTLYNWMTGAKFRTVNYPGSTVEYAKGFTLPIYGEPVLVVDTPGVRGLDPLSPDESVTFHYLHSVDRSKTVVVVPVDVSQLERNLVFVLRLIDAGYSCAVALTMNDILSSKGVGINASLLEKLLNCPVVKVDGRLGGGVKELFEKIKSLSFESKPSEQMSIESYYSKASTIVEHVTTGEKVAEKLQSADLASLKLDKFLLHPFWGLLTFALIMTGLFSGIFWMAQPAMDFVDSQIGALAEAVVSIAPGHFVTELLGSGLIAGVGSVIVFVPQIIILFLLMGLLEDSGYLARAATLVDKPLSLLGLNGRSFVPLLSGFACAIPAMMAARTISNPRERWLTLFIIPLMSCSARLPVYALLIGLLYGSDPLRGGITLSIIYFSSLFMGGVAAAIANRYLPKKGVSLFVLELPAYRRPQFKNVIRQTYNRTYSYLKRAGPTIVTISLTIWMLSNFPNRHIENESERVSQSYLAKLGQFLEPVMQPLGGDWKMGVGLLASFAAREVFVSTLALVYNVADSESEESLLGSLKNATTDSGQLIFTGPTIIGLLVYFMLALQCLTTVAVAKAETQSWKFAVMQLIVFTMAAYVLAIASRAVAMNFFI